MALASYGFYAFGDAAIRGIGQRLPALEMAFIGAIVSLLMSPLVARGPDFPIALIRPKHWWRWLLRGLFAVGGTVSGIVAWSQLPLAQTASILFLSPILTVALTPLVLKEKVTVREWIGLVIGFAGVLVVLRPGLWSLHWAHFAAIGCAVCGAGTTLLVRATRDEETPASMYGAACLSVIAVGAVSLAGHVVVPSARDGLLVLAFTVCGALAGMIQLFVWRQGRAALVAPVQYSQEVWGVVLGLLLFSERPDLMTIIGASLIVLGGVWPHVRWAQIPGSARTL